MSYSFIKDLKKNLIVIQSIESQEPEERQTRDFRNVSQKEGNTSVHKSMISTFIVKPQGSIVYFVTIYIENIK